MYAIILVISLCVSVSMSITDINFEISHALTSSTTTSRGVFSFSNSTSKYDPLMNGIFNELDYENFKRLLSKNQLYQIQLKVVDGNISSNIIVASIPAVSLIETT